VIGDAELRAFRTEYYGLLVSLLWREPGRALLDALGRGIEVRVAAAQRLHLELAAGWRAIAAYLAAAPADAAGAVADEYTRLFIGPYGVTLHPYESYYLTGRVFDRPLANLRAFLARIGVAKDDGVSEPEDWLACELDVMRRLLQRQADAGGPEAEARVVDQQAAFLTRHLLVWAPSAARDIARAEGAAFYRGVGSLLAGFLELERELIGSRGGEPVVSVEEARRRHAAEGEWTGPLFDLPGPRTGEREGAGGAG
jgi:TorA maturation chaperone TorD